MYHEEVCEKANVTVDNITRIVDKKRFILDRNMVNDPLYDVKISGKNSIQLPYSTI